MVIVLEKVSTHGFHTPASENLMVGEMLLSNREKKMTKRKSLKMTEPVGPYTRKSRPMYQAQKR